MQRPALQWFQDNESYWNRDLPAQLANWPKASLVRVNSNGTTQKGWGQDEFVRNQEAGHFSVERSLRLFDRYAQPYGIVMRSLPMLCVDIDGKNGGLGTSRVLSLPPTLAERSKGGNGYHLFYSIPYTKWDETYGYNEFPDVIGLIPGVDIKGTGIVFHFPNQKFNSRDVAVIPPALAELVGRAREIRYHSRVTKHGASALNDEDLAILHDSLLEKLNAKFTAGSRNNQLYKIGARMMAADFPNWEAELRRRGSEVGLDSDEVEEVIRNIANYA